MHGLLLVSNLSHVYLSCTQKTCEIVSHLINYCSKILRFILFIITGSSYLNISLEQKIELMSFVLVFTNIFWWGFGKMLTKLPKLPTNSRLKRHHWVSSDLLQIYGYLMYSSLSSLRRNLPFTNIIHMKLNCVTRVKK